MCRMLQPKPLESTAQGTHVEAKLTGTGGRPIDPSLCVNDEVCPKITEYPLFTGLSVRSQYQALYFGGLVVQRDRAPPQEAGLFLLPTPVALSLDININGGRVMEEAVKDRRRQHVVMEHLAPIRTAFVAGSDQTAPSP